MASTERTALPPRPRSRKSIAHMPSPDTIDKENATTDLSALKSNIKDTKVGKKSRSKSVGPGGLDGLVEGSGNGRRKVLQSTSYHIEVRNPIKILTYIFLIRRQQLRQHHPYGLSSNPRSPSRLYDRSRKGNPRGKMQRPSRQRKRRIAAYQACSTSP